MTDQRLRYLITAEDKASATFARLKGDMASLGASSTALGRVLGGIGPQLVGAFSVAALSGFIARTVDGIDALNDLKDATGASIENLSALEDVAVRTGTSMDTAGDAVLKLNKALNTASDPKSGAAEALRALGLSVDELKRLDPVLALQKVGVALAGFADDGNKGRVTMELLGKSTGQLAPLLKDLAEAGKLNATVTTEQAEAAEKFNKQLFALQKNATDFSRALAGPMINAINDTIDRFREGERAGKSFFTTLRDEQLKLLGIGAENPVQKLQREVAALDAALANPQLPEIMRAGFLEKRAAAAAELARQLGGAKNTFLRGDKDAGPASTARPSLPDIGDKPGKTGKQAGPYEVGSYALQEAGDLRAAFEAIDKINREWQPAEWFGGEASLYEAELLRKAFEAIEDVNANSAKEVERLAREAENALKLGRDAGQEVGLVFASAAGKAITEFQNLRGVLKGILADINQIAVRELVTKPLEGFLAPLFKDFSFASLLAGGRATGGPVQAGKMYQVNERGPGELLNVGGRQYLMAGQDGHVQPAGQRGSMLVQPTIINHIDARTDAAAVAQMVAGGVRAGMAETFDHLRAQGVLA